MRWSGVVLAVATVLASAAPLRAEERPCPSSVRPWVELVLEVEPPDRLVAEALEQHLRAELRVHDIDVCVAPVPGGKPIAHVRLRAERPAEGLLSATIEVVDEVTAKRTERRMDLGRLPPDTRSAVLGAAADELLRASWAELAVIDAPPPASTPPAAVTEAVASSLRSGIGRAGPDTRGIEVGVLGAASFFAQRDAFGARAVVAYWFLPRGGVLADLGGSLGLPRAGEHGTVRANGVDGGLSGVFGLVPRDRHVGARLELGARALALSYAPSPSAGDRGMPGGGWTVLGATGVRGWADTGILRWSLGATLVVPFHALRATDTGQTVTSVEGVGGEATLGVCAFF
jgi:hypothetical protein